VNPQICRAGGLRYPPCADGLKYTGLMMIVGAIIEEYPIA
jgi:hypothetical protein